MPSRRRAQTRPVAVLAAVLGVCLAMCALHVSASSNPPDKVDEFGLDDVELPRWTEQPEFTVEELAAAAGVAKEKLGVADYAAKFAANQHLLESDSVLTRRQRQRTLARFVREARANLERPVTDAQAKRLDSSSVLSPLEKMARDEANVARALGVDRASPSADPKRVYNQLVVAYRESDQSKADARALYDAMKGVGTTESAVFEVLGGRSTGEIGVLKNHFSAYCRSKGESNRSLQSWIEWEMSGGDEKKALLMLRVRHVPDDRELYWSTAAAHWWNGFLRTSDRGGKMMVQHGSNMFVRAIGYANQGIFAGAGAVNSAVKDAQAFWMQRAQRSTSGLGRNMNKAMFILATIGGSLGTKALDPTLTVSETEAGLFDLALTLGTLGAGRLVGAAATTTAGIKLLGHVARLTAGLRRSVYAARVLIGMAPTAGKLEARAAKMLDIARKARAAGNPTRADQAAEAAQSYSKAAKSLRAAEDAAKSGTEATKAAERLAASSDDAKQVVVLQEKAVEELLKARNALDMALDAQRTARAAANVARWAAVPGVNSLKAFLGSVKTFFIQSPAAAQRALRARVRTLNQALLGGSDDAVRATTLSRAQIQADRAAVAAGKMPSWAKQNHGGFSGNGVKAPQAELRQTQFWDNKAGVWRNGPNSKANAGASVGDDIAGTPVDLTGSGVKFDPAKGSWQGPAGTVPQPTTMKGFRYDSAKGVVHGPGTPSGGIKWSEDLGAWTRADGTALREVPDFAKTIKFDPKKGTYELQVPAVDLCKVNPTFCTGPHGFFCQRFPALCAKHGGPKGLLGRPRNTMPQVEDLDRFLDYLATQNGGVRPAVKTVEMSPSQLSITQVEISAHKTASVGDGLTKAGGYRPPPTLSSKDLTVVDGHHRWSAYNHAKYLGGPQNMPVTVIDMPIDDIIRATDKLLESGELRDVVSFASLLELAAAARVAPALAGAGIARAA